MCHIGAAPGNLADVLDLLVWIDNAAAGSKTYTLTEGGRTLATTTTTSNGPVSIPWVTTAADNGPGRRRSACVMARARRAPRRSV